MKDLFVFPFRDPNWKNKLLIGSGISFLGMFIPLIPWMFVAGYGARLLRAGAANTDAERLPEWDHWGDLLMDGLRQTGVGLLASLPTMVLMGGGWLFYMIGVIRMTAAGENPGAGESLFMLASVMVMFFAMGLGMLFGLVTALFSPAAMAHVAVQRRFAALFDFQGWVKVLRANLGGFVTALLVFITVYTVIMFGWQVLYFTVILCFLAPLLLMPAAFYTALVFYRLVGQAYGEGLNKTAEAPASDGSAPLPVS
jgi:hypothetical protein